jgi:ketosteroid isomerase-like protein
VPASGGAVVEAKEHEKPVDITFETVGIVVATSGDLAYQVGRITSPAGPGKYLTVYRRIGGEWKIVADTWNDDAPAATTAAGSN